MNNLKSIKKILLQLSYIMQPSHKRRLFPLFIIMITSALLELVGVTIILPFVQAILEPDVIMSNKWVKPILQIFGITTSEGTLIFFGVAIIVLYIVKNAYIVYSLYWKSDYANCVQRDLANQILSSYMHQPYACFIEKNSAEIVHECNYDATGIYMSINALVLLATETITMALIVVFIVVSEPIIALGLIATMMITMLIIIVWFKPMLKSYGRVFFSAETERQKAIYQITQGIKEIFVTDRREIFLSKYNIANERHCRSNRNYTFLNQTPDRIVEAVCVTGMIGLVVIRVVLGGNLISFVPKMAAFVVAAFKLMPSVGKFTRSINELVYWQPKVQNAYNNIHDAEEFNRLQLESGVEMNSELEEIGNKREFVDKIEVKDVCWKYENTVNRVLDGTSLVIKKGEAVGFIGPSGSGKTTLSDIILGLLKPQSGSVYMDGVDVFKIPHTWAKIIGYVPQTVFLMDESIRENVVFGLSEYTDDEIWDALDRAALGDFVRSLPEGLDTVVGERGIKFSGGQRQRIAIARALFAKPDILVLDEATSALDNEAEKAIMESIDSLAGSVTLIIVAHRLTTIKNCDSIYRICDGKAVLQDKAEVLKEV